MWNNFVRFLVKHGIAASDSKTISMTATELTDWDVVPMKGKEFSGILRIKPKPCHQRYGELYSKRMLARKTGEAWEYAIVERSDGYQTPPHRLTWQLFE